MSQQMQIHLSYSCIELASYLGFPSKSHLVKLFHERYGIPPREHHSQYITTEYQK